MGFNIWTRVVSGMFPTGFSSSLQVLPVMKCPFPWQPLGPSGTSLEQLQAPPRAPSPWARLCLAQELAQRPLQGVSNKSLLQPSAR